MNQSASGSRHGLFDDIQALLVGPLLFAIGLYFMRLAGLLSGGAAGLTFLIYYATGINFGLLFILVNAPFYIFAYLQMGPVFTLKTVISVFMVALYGELLPWVISISDIHPFFAGASGGLLMGVSILILFRHGASIGGFNIMVLYLQQKFGISAGKVQMFLDILILLAGLLLVHWLLLLASIVGAILLNLTLAINHKPGRYTAF